MGSLDRPAFERGTGFLLARLGTLAQRSWTAFLSEIELTQSQYALLYVLVEYRELVQRRLAELATIEPRNVGYVIDELESARLVERAVDSTDRRRRIVRITRAGVTLMSSLETRLQLEQGEFLSPLSDDERHQLNALLQRILTSHTTDPT